MSFNADKKNEHEKAAEKALQNKDYAKAFFHTAKVADFCFNLAEQSEGKLARAYLDDANEFLEIATVLKNKAKKQKQKKKTKSLPVDDHDKSQKTEKSKWQLQSRSNLTLKDVAGLEQVKEQIKLRMLLPFQHPEKAKKHGLKIGGGILMYGPPGTGKTFIARATAGELNAAFFSIKPSEIMSKWVGEAEQRIRELFAEARKNKLSVIFVDEVESLVPARATSGSTVMQRVVPQFLAELEGVDNANANPILFMGATNEPWLIDSAMMRPGRFDVRVYVGLPDKTARKKIITTTLSNKEQLLSDKILETILNKTEGYSGADLKALVQAVQQKGFTQDISEAGFSGYSLELFEQCLQEVSPSVSQKQLAKYAKWKQQQG